MKMELRTTDLTLSNSDKDGLVVSGYVNKPGQLSEVLGVGKRFREKIQPGAFTRAIQSSAQDIEFLAEHDKKLVLASTRNGSLTLREDENGLFMEARISPTSWGRDYYQLITDKLISSMSFGFRVLKETWSKQNEMNIRTIHSMELYEVSAVKHPAYTQSTIAARSISIVEDPEIIDQSEMVDNEEKRNQLKNDIIKEELRLVQVKGMAQSSIGQDIDFSHLRNISEENILNMKNEVRKLKETEEKMEEKRALQMKSDNKEVLGVKVAEVVKQSYVKSTVFEKARKVEMTSEEIMVPIEQDFKEADFVEEGHYLPEIDLELNDYAKLKQKRVGAVISASRKLVYDSSTNLEEYLKELVLRRTEKRLEKAILVGDTEKEFKGITSDEKVKSVQFAATPTVDMFRGLYKSIKNEFVKSAAFYIEEDYFDKVVELKTADGSYLVKEIVINDEVVQTIFGRKVEVTDSLTANKPVVFGSIENCYTIGINSDLVARPVTNDTTNVLRGSIVFVAEFYGDGAVTNYQAVSTGTVI